MTLTLHIAHDASHRYLARVFDGQVKVGESTLHGRIDEAIAWYGQPPSLPGVTAFRVWYGGWCAGTFELQAMREQAEDIANRLRVLAVVER